MGKKSQLINYSFLSLLFVSCSFSSTQDVSTDILEESDESLVVVEDDEEDISFEDDYVENVLGTRDFRSDSVFDTYKEQVQQKEQVVQEVTKEDEYDEYIVLKGDTAIKIAFDLYKDIGMWKKITDLNGKMRFSEGETIRVPKIPKDLYYQVPEGSPYMVEEGDNLGSISGNVYEGKRKYWLNLWVNNKSLIKDKNLIYPGFTIFYKDYPTAKSEYASLKKMHDKIKSFEKDVEKKYALNSKK